MAAEDEGRTEEASEYKLEKARKEGRVAKSQELSGALVLLFSLVVLIFFSSYIFRQLINVLKFYFLRSAFPDFTNKGLLIEFYNVMIRCILPISFVGVAAGFAGNIIQNKGWIFSTKPITPNFSKIVPKFGEYFKKTVFSAKGLFNIVKSIGKVALIIFVAYLFIKKDIFVLIEIIDNGNIIMAVQKIGYMAAQILVTVAILFLAIAIPDYFVQKKDFLNEMKMTKQEQKEEYKEMEGDPETKARLQQMQQELLKQNIPKAVSESDVVIANPQHFAVALKYDMDDDNESPPIVNAKGQDNLAQTIKTIARENNIPIVEDRPLARVLYTNVEVGGIIPVDYWKTIAVIYSHLDKFNKQ